MNPCKLVQSVLSVFLLSSQLCPPTSIHFSMLRCATHWKTLSLTVRRSLSVLNFIMS